MKDIHIKPALRHVLQNMSDTPFTVAQLTQKYLKHPESQHTAKKSARQYVYRKMLRLIEHGQMIKLPDNNRWPRYELTSIFISTVVDHPANTEKFKMAEVIRHPSSALHPHEFILREKLSQYRSDMLCALGESEEYSALCNDYPDLRESAQDLYNEARERGATLLGKIKALENMLTHHAG
ncbi:hypothetical protein AB4876_18470 [Zhongshania guokunii]|uniref:Transcriptional regulator VspR n=1 Tax=Zhongshania guokunii TaxID=641783 RepID=A0ABV3UCC7_9GAMM